MAPHPRGLRARRLRPPETHGNRLHGERRRHTPAAAGSHRRSEATTLGWHQRHAIHWPGHKYRSERGEWTPRSYYDESYDYLAFRDLLLRPLGRGGGRRCRAAIWDSSRDVPMEEKWIEVTDRAILVVRRFAVPARAYRRMG